MTFSAALAERALAPVPDAVREHLRVLLLGNVAAGAGELGAAGALIARVTEGASGPGEDARRLAMQLHARTQDDFFPHGRIHVGAVTLATALGLGDVEGADLLTALAAGYDVMCRVSAAYTDQAQRRGMRPTGIFGPLGAAATAGRAMGFDRDGIANAIGLAATMSAGHNQAWVSGTDEWMLEVGAAARAGVEAARLTEAGAVASAEAFEGSAGWAKAYFGDPGAERVAPYVEADDSGVLEVAVKPYPVSGIAEVPTWLACQAHDALAGAEPDEIELGICAEEAAYPGSANRGPFPSRSAALMSLAFCVSCGLEDGLVPLARLEEPGDPAIERLIERFAITVRDDLGESEATLTVTAGEQRIELRGEGGQILLPRWDDLDSEELAGRNEAATEIIDAARVEVMREAPGIITLRDLLEGTQCPVGSKPSSAASTS